MANDLSAFQAQAWSQRMVEKLDQINIMLGLVNRNWEGDLRQHRSVQIRTPGNIAMAPYTRGTTISYQDLAPVLETFTVNDGQYFAFEVDDLDKAQNDLNAMDVYMKRAVVAMNNVVETKLMGAYVYVPGSNILSGSTGSGGIPGAVTVVNGAVTAIALGTAGSGYTTAPVVTITGGGGMGARAHATVAAGAITGYIVDSGGVGYTTAPTATVAGGAPITLDSTTGVSGIYQQIVAARTLQSNANVPLEGRWLVVDPATTGLLLQDTAHFIRASDLGDAIVQNAFIGDRTAATAPGFIGRVLGYSVYETPHIITSGGAKQLLFGDNEAITYAAQITEIEAIRLQTTFANAIRGLLLHDTFVPAECAKRLVVLRAA